MEMLEMICEDHEGYYFFINNCNVYIVELFDKCLNVSEDTIMKVFSDLQAGACHICLLCIKN